MGADVLLLAPGDGAIRDPLRGSLFTVDDVECSPHGRCRSRGRTERVHRSFSGKPHRTRFPTAPTRIISQRALHTEFRTLPRSFFPPSTIDDFMTATRSRPG